MKYDIDVHRAACGNFSPPTFKTKIGLLGPCISARWPGSAATSNSALCNGNPDSARGESAKVKMMSVDTSFYPVCSILYYRNIKSNVNSPPPMQLQGTLHMCAILMVSFSDCRAATSVPLTCRVVGNDFCVFYGPTQTEQMFSSLTTGFSLSFFFKEEKEEVNNDLQLIRALSGSVRARISMRSARA